MDIFLKILIDQPIILGAIGLLLFACLLVKYLIGRQVHFGLSQLPNAAFILLGIFWAFLLLVMFGLFFFSLYALALEVHAPSDPDKNLMVFRVAAALTVQTTVIGALISLPITLRRTRLATETGERDEEGQITDRINAAVQNLGATRVEKAQHLDDKGNPRHLNASGKSKKASKHQPIMVEQSLPNLEVRLGALFALERIAQNHLDFHIQVMEVICAYIRTNAPASSARDLPEEITQASSSLTLDAVDEIRQSNNYIWADWKEELPPIRADIITALQILSRRSTAQKQIEAAWGNGDGIYPFSVAPPILEKIGLHKTYRAELITYRDAIKAYDGYRLPLQEINLQGAELSDLDLSGANISGSHFEGANLSTLQLRGAIGTSPRFNATGFLGADCSGSSFSFAQFDHSFVDFGSSFAASDLYQCSFDLAYIYTTLDGARVNSPSLLGTTLLQHLRFVNFFNLHLYPATNVTNDDLDMSQTTMTGMCVDNTGDIKTFKPHWPQIFVSRIHGTIGPDRPSHWPSEALDRDAFNTAYEAWLETMYPIWDRALKSER